VQLSKAEIRQRQQQQVTPKGHNSTRPHTSPVVAELESESFSCRRQHLELYCEDGRRHTQFVLRWFYKEGACYSYPWGYCPGGLYDSCFLLCAQKGFDLHYVNGKHCRLSRQWTLDTAEQSLFLKQRCPSVKENGMPILKFKK
jgi:hypothetical protein